MTLLLGFTIGRVQGNSMVPRIRPNSFFIASRWYSVFPCLTPMKEGQIYYINHARYGLIIKTLHCVDKQNQCYWFRGESSESVSTEALGLISASDIIGRVIWVIQPTQ